MAALVTVYDAGSRMKRRPHDVIAPPGGRHGDRCTASLGPGRRPWPQAKWLAGSVRKDPAEVIAAAFDEAEARDPGHLRTWVVLVDGAEHQLDPDPRRRFYAARAQIHIVIDPDPRARIHMWKAAVDPARRRRPRRRGLVAARGRLRCWSATAPGRRRGRSPPRGECRQPARQWPHGPARTPASAT